MFANGNEGSRRRAARLVGGATLDHMGDQVTEATPVIVVLPAEIDVTNAGQVLATLTSAFEQGVSLVVADMTSTVFCDTSGVRALVEAQERAVTDDIGFRLAIPPEGSVRRVLELTGIIRLLPVYLGMDEAIKPR
jgi:anti-sigma B factor antagonist